MMNLNTGALIKSAGIGAVVLFVMVVINMVSGIAGYMSGAASVNADPTMMQMMSFVGLCCGCFSYLLFGGIGALYGWFAQRDEPTLDVGMTALGGALAAAIDGLLYGIMGMISGLLTSALILPAMMPDLDPESAALMVGMGATFGVLGGIIGICISLGVGGLLGAIGGAIYAAVAGNRSSQNYGV